MATPTLTANSPIAGSIAWSAFSIQYAGVTYTVSAGSTPNRYVWWLYNSGSPILTAGMTLPVLGSDDLLLFVNKSGIPINVPKSTVVDGSLIVDGTIVGTAIVAGTVHGDRIQGDTITANQIAANAITANELAADSVVAAKIKAGEVIAGKLAADSVVAANIAAGQITAVKIAADTITANEMAVDSITANELAAGSVEAEHIKVGLLESGRALTGQLDVTGSIRVKDSSWSPSGLVFPGSLVLPSVAGGQATINANITAKSLTVEKDLNILGVTNKIAGSLLLSNGITTPTVAPAAWSSVPSIQSEINVGQFGPIQFGMAPHLTDGNIVLSAQAFYGGALVGMNINTGAYVYLHDTKPWGHTGPYGFNPYGVATANGAYYVLGIDSARSGWWIYKLNSTYDKVQELGLGEVGPSRPTLGTDGGNLLVTVPATDSTTVLFYNTNLVPASYQTYATTGTTVNSQMASVQRNVFDLGSMHMMIGVEDLGVFTFVENGGQVANSFVPKPDGANMRGNLWKNSRLYTLGTAGRLFKHGLNAKNQTLTVSHTWYDGVGTARETQESPATTFVQPARTNLGIQTPPPPDSGSSEVNVDKANRVGVYVGVNGASRRRQIYLPLAGDGVTAVTLYDTEAVNTTNPTPPVANGFIGGVSSPGLITNPAGTLRIEGDGTIDCVSVNNVLLGDTGWITLSLATGWSNFDAANWGSAVYRILNRVVYLRGLLTCNSGYEGTTALTLPVGVRPAVNTMFMSTVAGTFSRMDVSSGGTLSYPGSTIWGSFNSIVCTFPLG